MNPIEKTLLLAILAFHCVEANAQYAAQPAQNWAFTATVSPYIIPDGRNYVLHNTPMLGGVFGNTVGIAPGQRIKLTWRRLEFLSEDEFLFNTRESTKSFFYAWSEVTIAPFNWLRVGMVGQRTHAYQTQRDIQRGLLVGFKHKHVGLTLYALNPDENPLYIISANVEF